MKKRVLLILGALIAVTVGLAAYYRGSASAEGPRLNTVAVTRGAVVESVNATGTLAAVETVEVGTQVSGTIKALYADYNDRVRKGQLIAQLEPSLFETQVEQARATVQRLQADVEARKVQVVDADLKLRRAGELSARQLLPASDLETAESNARQAQAAVKGAEAQLVQGLASLNQSRVNLGHATIVAPIDGIVISRNVDVGQTVAASMSAPTLFVLARDLTRMQVNAKIDEADIGRIGPSQAVTFAVDAYAGEKFTGTVRQVRLEPVVEQNVVSYVTVVDVPNPDLKLKPGMTATVTVEVARADEALRVPTAALRFRPTAEVFAALGQEPPAADGEGAAPAAERQGPPPSANREGPAPSATGGTQRPAADRSGQQRSFDRGEQRPASDPTGPQPSFGRGGRRPRSNRGGQPSFDRSGQRPSSDGRSVQRPSSEDRSGQRPASDDRNVQRPASDGGGNDVRAVRGTGAGRAVVWVLRDGRLRRVPVRTSTSDGVITAVVGGELQEGDQVVTGVVAQAAPAASSSTGSPLLPRRPGNRGNQNARPPAGAPR